MLTEKQWQTLTYTWATNRDYRRDGWRDTNNTWL